MVESVVNNKHRSLPMVVKNGHNDIIECPKTVGVSVSRGVEKEDEGITI